MGSRNPTILIADDEENARSVLGMILRDSGYDVIEARDGIEAISHALTASPALILMDVGMPLMDGCQAAELIQSRPRSADIPIVACTGLAQAAEEWESLFKAIITKPFTADTVIATIERFVEPESGAR